WRGESSAIVDAAKPRGATPRATLPPPRAQTRNAGVRPDVCVTGMGIATSLGVGKDSNWRAVAAGRSGVRRITRFDTSGLRTTIGATIDDRELGHLPFVRRTEELACIVVEEALAQAGLPLHEVRAPLFLGIPPAELSWADRLELALEVGKRSPIDYEALIGGTNRGEHATLHEEYLAGGMATRLAERFGASDAPITVNTACATGATAIQLAVEAIRRREADIAIAVASDASIVPDTIVRFSLLGVVHEQRPSRPSRQAIFTRPGRFRAGRRRGGPGFGKQRIGASARPSRAGTCFRDRRERRYLSFDPLEPRRAGNGCGDAGRLVRCFRRTGRDRLYQRAWYRYSRE